MKTKISYFLLFLIAMLNWNTLFCQKQGTLKDKKNGYVYKTVIIGNQVWMAENLKSTTYNDGSLILKISDKDEWHNNTDGAYCWFDNDSSKYEELYGKLYNYKSVESKKLCPKGWHVPTKDDWDTLEAFLGGLDAAGDKMKSKGNEHWLEMNENATNESGFTGLPGGYRTDYGYYYNVGYKCYLWTYSDDPSIVFYGRLLSYDDGKLSKSAISKLEGYSVRCIKD